MVAVAVAVVVVVAVVVGVAVVVVVAVGVVVAVAVGVAVVVVVAVGVVVAVAVVVTAMLPLAPALTAAHATRYAIPGVLDGRTTELSLRRIRGRWQTWAFQEPPPHGSYPRTLRLNNTGHWSPDLRLPAWETDTANDAHAAAHAAGFTPTNQPNPMNP